MISKTRKKEIVEGLIEKFKKASGVFLVNFNKMTVEEAISLRRSFREKDVEYRVAKNTLIKRALAEVEGFDFPDEIFVGQTAIAFGYEDPVAPGKVIKAIFDKFEKPSLKAAIIDSRYFDGSKLNEIAALPTRNDLMASIVGCINAPASGIVGAINAVLRDVAYLVEEVANKQNAA